MPLKYDIERISEVLGLHLEAHERPPSKMWLSKQIQEGFPVSALVAIYRDICEYDSVLLRHIASLSTLQRRRRDGQRLSPDTSDALVRVARVWILTLDAYGDQDMAKRFFTSPHSMLGGESPLSVSTNNAAGADAVACLIDRLSSGVAV